MSLERFHEAQASRWAGYDMALAEIRAGGNAATGFGTYFLKSKASVVRRPRGPTPWGISARLALTCVIQSCGRATKRLSLRLANSLPAGSAVEDLMGSQTDALKLVSSLTLFHAAAKQLAREDPVYASLAEHLAALLGQTGEQGYAACDFTLARIDHSAPAN